MIDKLNILGLDIDTLNDDEVIDVESYEIISQWKAPQIFQGLHENIVTTKLVNKKITFKKGTYVIPMNQKRSNLAVETLEPDMLSGFFRFNVIQPHEISKIHRYTLNKELWKSLL